jgi:hypothetical protein
MKMGFVAKWNHVTEFNETPSRLHHFDSGLLSDRKRHGYCPG